MKAKTTTRTIVPKTRNVQRIGLGRELVRVVTVELFSTVACSGGGALHLARGLRFTDGSPCSWYVTDAEAERFGWLA